jgi:phytoene synthase
MQALMPHVPDYASSRRTCWRDRRLPDGPGSRPLPRLSPRWQRYCHLVAGVVGEVARNIFGRTQRDHRVRAPAGPGDAADQHHPRRGRRRAARPHLPAVERAAAVRRQGPRAAQARAPWGYSDASAR